MAERVMPRDALNQKTVMADDDQQTVYNKTQNRNDNAEFSDMRTYYEERLKDGTTQMNPRSFTSGRFDSKELVSGTLSVSGWYTIAETGLIPNRSKGARFRIASSGGSSRREFIEFNVSIINDAVARIHANTYIEVKGRSVVTSSIIPSVRIAKSDSVATSGQKIQVLLDISTTMALIIQISENLADLDDSGFFLIDPTQTDIGLLPDGVTTATFLEAGEELNFGTSGAYFVNEWEMRISSDDLLLCSVLWPEIPKQGTTLTLTLPATALTIIDGIGTTKIISGAHTISNLIIIGKHLYFFINEVGAFAGLNASKLGVRTDGTGCKLTIT